MFNSKQKDLDSKTPPNKSNNEQKNHLMLLSLSFLFLGIGDIQLIQAVCYLLHIEKKD